MINTEKPSIEDALNLISEGRLDLLPSMAEAYKEEVKRMLEKSERTILENETSLRHEEEGSAEEDAA